jgi:putative restriction endonuclease
MIADVGIGAMTEAEVLACLSSLRLHQRAGQRSPHKPLLVLYALGQLAATGSSAVAWPAAAEKLADLIRDHYAVS